METGTQSISMLVMDVDGTMTDGKIHIGAHGELFKSFNAHDGYRIRQLPDLGIIPVVITGRSSEMVSRRMEDLAIDEVHQDISDKLSVLKQIAKRHGLSLDQIAYIGDDENDLECIRACPCSACPADAVTAVKQAARHVMHTKGGDGAVREFIDTVLLGPTGNSESV